MPSPLQNRRIAFTSPASYCGFLRSRLDAVGAISIWMPTIAIQFSQQTRDNLHHALTQHLSQVFGIAFTSRNGIVAVAESLAARALAGLKNPFLIGALGRDVQCLSALGELMQHPFCQIISPDVATPQALVEALGDGQGRQILCPVPEVVGLPEPDVVPSFLLALSTNHWHPIRVNAYQTVPASVISVGVNLRALLVDQLDALIFTSTAEAHSLLQACQTLRIEPQTLFNHMTIAAHGPVTARGIENLGITVSVVSQNSASFGGVILALEQHFRTNP